MIEKIEKEINSKEDLIISKEEIRKFLKNSKEKIKVIIEFNVISCEQDKKKLLSEILNYKKIHLIDPEIKRRDAYED